MLRWSDAGSFWPGELSQPSGSHNLICKGERRWVRITRIREGNTNEELFGAASRGTKKAKGREASRQSCGAARRYRALVMAFSLPLSQVIGAGVSSTVGFSSTPISSCRTSAEAAASSPAALCCSSSLWGSKIRFSRGGAPASTSVSKAGSSSLSLSPQALLLDDEEEETEEEITAAYEALYGKAFSGLASSKSDSRGMDDGDKGRRDRGPKEFEERVVQIRRVTKVVKGGKQLSFRAVVVLGDKKGRVGVGVAKAKEVIIAVQKAGTDARRHIITVPMTKYLTFPHRADGQYGAAKVMLRPAATGTGVIAGGSVRVVLELAGVENALGKEIGSKNPLNNARAVVEAVTQMKQFRDVAADRGIPMEELWK